jgi:hypothetical protein
MTQSASATDPAQLGAELADIMSDLQALEILMFEYPDRMPDSEKQALRHELEAIKTRLKRFTQ